MRFILVSLMFALAACSDGQTTRLADTQATLPPMKTFARGAPAPTQLANSEIARDYLDLVFSLENGAEVPVYSRFEGPISVRVIGNAPANLTSDLSRLLTRLRREARIEISRVPADRAANITIEPVTRAQIQRVAPSAACFVRPNVSSWAEYRSRRNDPETFWTRLAKRERMAIFLPRDVSPQEIRDCLHEEIAQALGPVNDLYRLTQSIFNDDNFHTVLTGYDMLILRAHYEGTLKSGMSRNEVSARILGVLNRLNPRGRSASIAPPRAQPAEWRRNIDAAATPGNSRNKRRNAAERAVELSRQPGVTVNERAFSYFMLGRLSLAERPDQALSAFLNAGRLYENAPDTQVQSAHVAMQLAAFQLSADRPRIAIALVDQYQPIVEQAEHAALLSLLLMVKAEALQLLGRSEEGRNVQRDALAWARYGFGAETEIRDRAEEILAISPRSRRSGA